MKNYASPQLQQSGRGSIQDNPYYMELKSKKSNSKIANTERTSGKNTKQDLLEYFKKERNTLTQVTNSIKTQLQQNRSIDNLNSQKSERFKTLNAQYQQIPLSLDQRLHTDEGNNIKRQLIKGKNLSLATIQMESKQQKINSKQSKVNQTPQSAYKMPKSTVDQYFQDMQIKSAKQYKNHPQIEYQQYFNIRPSKTSLLQESQALKQSIEHILSKNKGDSKKHVKRVDSTEPRSINQSTQYKGESSKKINRAEESNHYDPKKQLKIVLFYKNQKYNYLFDYQNKTTDNLYNYLIQQIGCIEKSFAKQGGGTGSTEEDQIQQEINKICQFYCVQKNVPYDYYLSLPNLSLHVFQGITLQLQPLIAQSASGKRVNLKDFALVKCIGVGGFSRVYLVRKRDNGKFYALKLIDKSFIMENQKEVIVQNERDIMVKMDNQFITPLHFAFETKYYIAFVLDYCAGGELFFHLRKLKRLSEQDAKYYFAEICIGMAYLHAQNIVYRDIKPENILLDLQGHLLLSDFGLSKPNMSPEDFAYSFCGSPEYMAPEMLLKSGHNYLVDCYCLGALLYELVTGLPPFYSHNTQEIYNSILTEQVLFPPYVQISDLLKDLIYQLLEKDPSQRIGQTQGVIEILTHPWFADADFEAIVNKSIKPPYKPEPLQYNFDEEEFNKGDVEFRKQYNANLQKEYYNDNFGNYILQNFYYSREDLPESPEHKSKRSNVIDLTQLHFEGVPEEQSSPERVGVYTNDFRRVQKYQGKSDIQDFLKRSDQNNNKSSSLIQSSKISHAYSKTMQQQHSHTDLQTLRLMIDSTKMQLSSERTPTLPENQSSKFQNNRIKTEQISQMLYPKTTTNYQFNKQTNLQKLFGSDKRKK
ncbi:unnamed protein product (macronuclear) [Paramecium tetraurelia]|uniref:Protein kinase domain-containing protein n=1 Tax=Paramecium tetraurelia TaxID=5888 RepID=A0CST1_PARTE|nr:uncharacterized protein GSPATT00010120001 [Paramecium tetraurelia]CAK73848.1 unnamed protein product [Paramecium tetraurelia]|eukprot:XP_001441245.1 hypothetical protein (macronuclear) [Paramecium tetraurelia strain d4-2]